MTEAELKEHLTRSGNPATTDEEGAAIAAEVAGAVYGLLQRGVTALENLARAHGFQPE